MKNATWWLMPLAVVLALTPRPSAAADPPWQLSDYARDVWRLTEGLPQESVTAILQTRDGYLWVSTLDGLARFDGVSFDTFNLIRTARIASNVVTALVEAEDGSLYVGTSDGVVRYGEGRFSVVGGEQGLRGVAVRTLRVGRDGALWIGTRWNGVMRLLDGQITTFNTATGLSHNDVRSILDDEDGSVWIGSVAGLDRLAGGRLVRVPLPPADPPAVVTALHIDARRTLWIGTTSGLWAMDLAGKDPSGVRGVAPSWGVQALVEAPDGGLWVGTGSGLGRIIGGSVERTAPGALSFPSVRSLALDHEGSLWIGTDGGGLNRFRKASVVMREPAGAAAGRPLMAVLRGADGTMWTGAHCGGVIRWAGHETTTFTKRDGLPDDCVRSLAEDHQGAIWIGTRTGLARLKNGRITTVTTKNGLSDNRVQAIMVARNGDLWVGTGSGGVDRFDGARWVNYSTSNGLAFNDVRALIESADGSVWIGTLGGGLNRWRDGVVTRLSQEDGLSSNHVLALLQDRDGTLWVGTNGGGLNRIRDGRIVAYGTQNGLFSDGTFVVLDDGLGSLWMGCNRGIFRVSRRDLEAVAAGTQTRVRSEWFGQADGLKPANVLGGSQSAGAVDAAGRLWFPTIEGVAIVDPKRLTRNSLAPPVLIQRVRVDQQDVPPDGWAAIPPGRRTIEIDYTALSFIAPSRMAFRYRLTGASDSGWIEAGTRRTAYFTNLRAGRYTFHVLAANSDGVWNTSGATAELVLLPRFYETRLFALAGLLAAAGAGWGGVRLRERQLRARQRELSRQVEEALAQVKVLSGLLPVCSWCHRVRDEGETWKPVEQYINEHSDAKITHGLCPDCMRKHYPDVVDS